MKKRDLFLPYVVALLLCVCISIPVFSNSIVMDEAYSIELVRGSMGEIIRGTAGDVHPPLYYLILKISAFFGGEDLMKYRFVTALATYLNLLWLGATVIRKRWGSKVSLFYLLWFGLSYSTIEKSTLVRMYSWGAFFVTASALFLFAYYEKSKVRDLVVGVLMTLGAMYSHYYAVMAVFSAWLVLLVAIWLRDRKQIWKILLCGVVIGLGYLPWLGVVLQQSRKVSNSYWITSFDWNEWFSTPALLMDNIFNGLGIAMYFLIFVLFVRAIIRKKIDALASMTVFLGTMFIGALLSLIVAPIWTPRYLYVAWGMLSLFAAIVIGEDGSLHMLLAQGGLFILLCVMGFFSVRTMLQDELMTSTASEWVAYLKENVEADACLIVDDPYEHYVVYRYYLPEADFVMVEELTALGGKRSLTDILNGDQQLWYVVNDIMPRCGVTRMSELMEAEGFEIEQTAYYTIQDKRLEVFAIGERAHEE
ncbi:MAG: glycosyltransferase family 39 protein [Acetatifactor sp.]|nr:glycosyltransferase family 39 protein [Acetatifactor sp.]